MNYAFMTLKEILIDYNQFKKSKLQPDIMRVFDCSYTEAFELGKTYCNVITTWALVYANGSYNKSFAIFLRDCFNKKLCTKEGYFKVDKPVIFEKLGIKCRIEKSYDYPDVGPGEVYQIALNDKHHFTAGASTDDNEIMLFDTNDRPYGEELMKALSVKNDSIVWFKKFINEEAV